MSLFDSVFFCFVNANDAPRGSIFRLGHRLDALKALDPVPVETQLMAYRNVCWEIINDVKSFTDKNIFQKFT